jgi:NitT/TauT family transport system substrate-binding protein
MAAWRERERLDQETTAGVTSERREEMSQLWSKREGARRSGFARLALAVLAACGLALSAAACGDDDDGGGEEGGPATLNVGVIPIADVAPLYLGIEEGFFEEENLTIEPQPAEGGAAIVPAVMAGENQIGFSNTTSLITAASEGLPLQIISQGVLGGAEANEDSAWDAVLVSEDSPIRSPQDLEGRTIAVNTLRNVGPLTINTALEQEGVDYTKVEYTEVPFPDMPAALDAGRVDAIWAVEPFVSAARGAGARTILFPYEQTAPDYTVATYFASSEYIEGNEDVIDRFVRAMNRSLDFAQQNPDAVREIVTTYTEIPPEAAESMTLPQWRADLNVETIEQTAQLAEEYGFIESQPDLGELIREQE